MALWSFSEQENPEKCQNMISLSVPKVLNENTDAPLKIFEKWKKCATTKEG